tara:strand:- start:702 stop:1652 length:951 start_codon:yes stop_codon:yes gene_type:complete
MSKFWKNKKVLVTGAHGFVGRNLIPLLEELPIKDLLAPTRRDCNLVVEAEVRDFFAEHKPDIVLHLAGKVGGIAINKAEPGNFFYDNIMMGVLVTHHSYVNGAKKLVSLAAGCGYPKNLEAPFTEEGFWEGLPDENSYGYSMAKKNLIIQSWAYREQYGFDSTVLLPANLYGPYDNFDLETSHVAPALIRKFAEAVRDNSEEVEIWGSGTASREFLYSGDTAKAILDIAEKSRDSGPFNLGTGEETSIKELVEIIKEATGFEGKLVWDSSRPDGQKRRYYDMSKFKEATGYIPNTSLKEGILKTLEWYKKSTLFLS